MRKDPLVSAVIPTANRPGLIGMAIACFERQTYESRELLILDDGESIRHLIPDDERIRYFRLQERMVLGEKQNLGCELARGGIICHWDDDDWSAADRIAQQVKALESSGKAVTAFQTMLYFDVLERRAWHYRGPGDSGAGNSLCYLKSFWSDDRFPRISVGHDSYMLLQANKRGELFCPAGSDQMVALRHSSNVSDFLCWQRCYEEVSVDLLPLAFLQQLESE
jgi:glycosyltransferase involved in cell wall biosynthesis